MRHCLSTLLAMIGIVALAGAVAAAIFFFQPFGRRAWIALLQASIMGSLMIALGNNPRGTVPAVSRYGPNGARFIRLAAKLLIGALGCWLGLVGWSNWMPEDRCRRPRWIAGSSELSPGTSSMAQAMERHGVSLIGR